MLQGMRGKSLTCALSLAIILTGVSRAEAAYARNWDPIPAPLAIASWLPEDAGLCSSNRAQIAALEPSFTAVRSKRAAILGGHMSKLDEIRAQQISGAGAAFEPRSLATAEPIGNFEPIEPALGADRGNCAPAGGLALATSQPQLDSQARNPAGGPDDFLASKKVRVGTTSFDNSWQHARKTEISAGEFDTLLTERPSSGLPLLQQVNGWTNHRISYVEDIDQYGVRDYWADARTTLDHRMGDCEDIAIAKLKLLAAAGLSESDMFLTVVRDRIRNADHAVLVVKYAGSYYLLDNATDQVLDAAGDYDYQPILSFNDGSAWLHGN